MSKEAEHKWHNRLLRKSTIEASIAEFNAELDDAVRSFQARQVPPRNHTRFMFVL